jgi:hypothetical protein
LEEDFLGQILAILFGERISASDFEHDPAVLLEPRLEQRFCRFVPHFESLHSAVIGSWWDTFLTRKVCWRKLPARLNGFALG